MAAEAVEQFAKRVITDSETPTAETVWHVFGASSEIVAYNALSSAPLPAVYTMPSLKVCYLDRVTIKDVFESSNAKDLTHEATATYVYKPPEDQVDYEFEAGFQTTTMTRALETTPFSGGGRSAPDFRGGINISSEGKVQGIDIEVPKFSFALTISWPIALVTRPYQLTVAGMVGKVNDAEYFGLPKGSVKFLGGNGRKQGKRFPITYKFEYSLPEASFTVGDVTVGAREGWWYTDIYRATSSDATAKKKVEFPHSVYLHRVYPYGDFSLLGLGTG